MIVTPSTPVFVTGVAGFIGFHLSRRLLAEGLQVVGLDAVTDYYDVTLKRRRLEMLAENPGFTFIEDRLETPGTLRGIMEQYRPSVVVHLAAQAGVRHSIEAPRSYVEANLIGTYEMLEAVRAFPPAHLMMASTSSVYGANTKLPYVEQDNTDQPLSFYAATKKANEVMAHSYAHLYDLPTTMFRFFSVYGTWGRPDLALFKFTKAVLADQPIDVYNHGNMMRDFTYVDDLTYAIRALMDVPPVRGADPLENDTLSPVAAYRVVNMGNSVPTRLMDFIEGMEEATGRVAKKNMLPMQVGDVPATWADATLLTQLIGPMPLTPVRDGIQNFVDWYMDYYGA